MLAKINKMLYNLLLSIGLCKGQLRTDVEHNVHRVVSRRPRVLSGSVIEHVQPGLVAFVVF